MKFFPEFSISKHNFQMSRLWTQKRNNISYKGSVSLDSQTDDENNSWNLGIDNPMFISEDPGSPDFLHLSPDSPAVDAGVDVGLQFNGSAPDLGAFEF